MIAPRLSFTRDEYATRLAKVHGAMARAGIELLWLSDPSNMAWLSGYDGWSFYVHQGLLVPEGEAPIWFGRGQDANGARRTVWLGEDRIIGYPDHYVQSTERHPMQPLAGLIRDRGWGRRAIGVEMDNYYFTAAAFATLRAELANASFKDATGLVNWQRAVKSPAELDYMRRAGRLVAQMHRRIFEIAEPGLPKHHLAAEIFHTGIAGLDGIDGDYPAIVPLLPSGTDAAAPHLTWDARPLQAGEGTFFEIAGCYRRYHCPLSRTIFLGRPPAHFRDAEAAVLDGLAAGLEQARAGRLCQDIANAFFAVLRRHGIEKDSRTGYAIGLSYPPDWGERTMSLRDGDTTELRAGMTFHFMTGLWMDDWGFETTESIVITGGEPELLADYPRRLFVKD